MARLLRLALAGLITFILVAGQSASAQDKHPCQAMRIVVTCGPGATDTVTRMRAEPMRLILHRAAVIENKPEARGLAAMDDAVKTKIDAA